ncbi:hypothetical protein BH10PSE14_BH10PSE14_39920 [soil metagenome]
MTIDIRGVFLDAWAMWRRDRGILLAIAGFFLFMPQLAVYLFGPDQAAIVAAADGAGKSGTDAQVQAMAEILARYAPLLLANVMANLFGTLAVLMIYFDRDGRDVGGTLLAALRRLPAYFVLALVVDVTATLGFHFEYVLLIPCFYLVGRMLLAGPIFADAGVGPIDAIVRSFRMTRGRGLVLAGFATLIILAGILLPLPAIMLGNVLDRAPLANPVSGLIIDSVAAAMTTTTMLGSILVRVALYRRIGASRGI